jgi:predicted nucleic acid-binding protein
MVDANVLFAATLWPRWPYEVIAHARKGDFQLVLAPVVIDAARDAMATRFPQAVERFESLLRLVSYEEVPDPSATHVARNRDLVRDVTDVPVALAAIKARVDYFVTEDKDFTDEAATTSEVRRRLNIMRPVIFLREVLGWTSEELERVRKRTWRDLEP